jgi:ATP-dependent DNA ligase
VFSIEEWGRDLFDAAERLDLESLAAKRKGNPYRPKTVWYKIKRPDLHAGSGAVGTVPQEVRLCLTGLVPLLK